jgi:hypothetical protein
VGSQDLEVNKLILFWNKEASRKPLDQVTETPPLLKEEGRAGK